MDVEAIAASYSMHTELGAPAEEMKATVAEKETGTNGDEHAGARYVFSSDFCGEQSHCLCPPKKLLVSPALVFRLTSPPQDAPPVALFQPSLTRISRCDGVAHPPLGLRLQRLRRGGFAEDRGAGAEEFLVSGARRGDPELPFLTQARPRGIRRGVGNSARWEENGGEEAVIDIIAGEEGASDRGEAIVAGAAHERGALAGKLLVYEYVPNDRLEKFPFVNVRLHAKS